MDKDIENIIKSFDFAKVHKVMEHLEWFWAGSQTESRVPSIGELVLHAKALMEQTQAEALERRINRVALGSGGFQVNYEDGIMNLQFVLDEWSEPGV